MSHLSASRYHPALSLLLLGSTIAGAAEAPLEEVLIWGEPSDSRQPGYVAPVSVLTRDDFTAINVMTTEDLVKYEPSLVIRRRFVGDSNGTLGLRGSNMFQTSRSMVFADGVPLHYLLQSRWSGAPRWTLISASEIARTEVIYGPFSAEYSGNAMGGVVLIESAIPQQREFHFDSSYMSQDFEAYGFDDRVDGYTTFLSYGDKLGDLSLYLSYNHLETDSQPQSFYYGGAASPDDALPVSGALPGSDDRGNPQLWFGDTGVENTVTDNYKLKLAYDFGPWQALLNLAYEDRGNVSNQRNSYIRDADGQTLWSGDFVQDGRAFSMPANRLGVSELERDSLNIGLRLKGELTDNSRLEFNVSKFDVLRDESRTSGRNPDDPAYTPAGQLTDFGNTGWRTLEAKLVVDELWLENLSLSSGLRHESYELNLDVYNSSNWAAGSKDAYSSRSGGRTRIDAAFAQATWAIDERWDATVGLRWENWRSEDGYYSDDEVATPDFDLVHTPSRSQSEFSPKFSLGFLPDQRWALRYSLARAWRFPIVEELFSQYQAYNAINEANPALQPEKGLHHNLMLERFFERGSLRLNLYRENIADVIESQATILPGGASIRTFIPMDEVQTDGIELIANAYGLAGERLDLRFNLAWTDSRIEANAADPSLVGKQSIRMPEWRANLLATWHLRPEWDLSANLQYAADSYGRSDNSDNTDGVFGGQDGYTRVGLKTGYRFRQGISLGIGVDNLSNEIAYVAHPWPGRTWYLKLGYDY